MKKGLVRGQTDDDRKGTSKRTNRIIVKGMVKRQTDDDRTGTGKMANRG